MNRNAKTKNQPILEQEGLRTRLDFNEHRLRKANKISGSEIKDLKSQEEIFSQDRKFAESIMETVNQPLVMLSSDLKVICANRLFYESFQLTPKEAEGKSYFDIGNHQWDIPTLRDLLNKISYQNAYFYDFEVDHEFPLIGRKTILLNARWIDRENLSRDMILLALKDITELIDIGEEIFSWEQKAALSYSGVLQT